MEGIFQRLTWLLLLITIVRCTDAGGDGQPMYVVEAFVFSGEPVEGIRIKELTPIDSGSNAMAPVINDATVVLVKSDKTFMLDFDNENESYYYPGEDLDINPGDEIRIEVEANGRKSYGETTVPQPPENVRENMDILVVPQLTFSLDLRDRIIELFTTARLRVEWDNEKGDLHYVVVKNLERELDPILPGEVPEEAVELLESFRFITEPTENTSFEVVGVALETYGTHVVKVYRVNDEYADLFQNDTQDSRDLNAPPTNMVGAFGIFSAFASDSVVFEVVRE